MRRISFIWWQYGIARRAGVTCSPDKGGRTLIAAIMITCSAVGGCDTKQGADIPVQQRGSAELAEDNTHDVALVRDFGVVRPKTEHHHTFRIENTSNIEWSIQRLLVGCACTVPKVSSNSIPPGRSADISIVYRVGVENRDDAQAIFVEFREKEAPRVKLDIRASIRAPVVVSEKRVTWRVVGQGQNAERTIYVHNFSDCKWDSLSIECSEPWLTVQSRLASDHGDERWSPRQKWQCRVRASAESLQSGKHSGSVRVSPVSASAEGPALVEIPVDVTVASAVAAVPDVLFFSSATCGESLEASTDLVFQLESPPPSAEAAEVSHDMDDELQLRLTRESANVWRLFGTWIPSAVGVLRGEITVSFPAKNLPKLKIPVMGRATAPEK